jgi:hypothetical protein
VQVNGTSGGRLVWPGAGESQASLSMANTSQGSYEFLVLQYDGSGIFRVLDASPATAQAIGIIGAAGISHWSYPAASGYIATGADNGNVISSVNSPLPYMAITLPSTTVVPGRLGSQRTVTRRLPCKSMARPADTSSTRAAAQR